MAIITFEIRHKLLTIFIDEITHLQLRRDSVVGFTSWLFVGVYSIEITYESGAKIVVEYDSIGKWKKVINCLKEHLMPLD